MEAVAKIPTSTQTSLRQRLTSHAQQRWPQISQIHTRYRANFAYIDAVLADGEELKLCRLRYGGSAHQWGFAIYRASHDDYDILPPHRPPGRHRRGSTRHCLRPLPRRSHGMDLNPRRTNGDPRSTRRALWALENGAQAD